MTNSPCDASMGNCLKGDSFLNRYRIEGVLTTASPFHLGNGDIVHRKELKNEEKKLVDVSAITTDYQNRPVIPGSSIKGSLRSFLYQVMSATEGGRECLAYHRDFEELQRKSKNNPDEWGDLSKQENQIPYARKKLTMLERLFGSPFAEGKIEVWDAHCITTEIKADKALLKTDRAPFWDPDRLTFVDHSVAIDPDKGTAMDQRLYHYEVVPPGMKFQLVITGQNLTPAEVGMLRFGLKAINSNIWPLRFGAMGGRGFGRFSFKEGDIRYLETSKVGDWIQDALNSDEAGYEALPCLKGENLEKRLNDFKNMFLKTMGGDS